MKNRRDFLKTTALLSGAIITQTGCFAGNQATEKNTISHKTAVKPIVISTWNHGLAANDGAWEVLKKGGTALDAVQKGVMVTESDASNQSVGLGGRPDRDGKVTLDACIMNHKNECGAVACIENIENPVAVARHVMEDTPHVLLVGEGAQEFAIEKGFKKTNLLTEKSKRDWQEWLKKSQYKPKVNIENHDTIGMLAIDSEGNLSGACTTSGMAYKLHGRVGDSPIIGAGLFVDGDVGAACATGVGEAVIRIAGSAIVVELMRQGKSPYQACKEAVERIVAKHDNIKNLQVGFIALNKNGEHGGYSIYKGFNYALRTMAEKGMVEADFVQR